MKVIVIGAGLLGLTTAYFLRSRGYQVTVIDRRGGVAEETSFANGALLTPSMSEPWNAPGSWRVLLSSLLRSDAAMILRLRALPSLLGWGIKFLRNSEAGVFERNTESNLRLALYSMEVMESLNEQVRIEYARTTRGTLRIFRGRAELSAASLAARRLQPRGLSFRELSRRETIDLEPALAPIAKELFGSIHYSADETGDAYAFCLQLAKSCQLQGVEFILRTEIDSIEVRDGRVISVGSKRDRFGADRYVVAAGSYSGLLLLQTGVSLPVRPVKGYSLTLDHRRVCNPLSIPVIDDRLHAGVVPLGRTIRVVGTAEFAGYDQVLRPDRIRNLLKLLSAIMPAEVFDVSAAQPWCGFRPVSADGVPIIGATPLENLLVNTGHGHLGWTMAAGSAKLLVALLSEDTPSIDPAPYALSRF